jgi:hypothetical protein
MKITSDKESTKIVKKFLTKIGSLTFHDNWNGFGDVTIRIVSVGETDKWNWNENKYSRVLNIEITMKKKGERFSEDRIPTKHYWSETRISFYKRRKSNASVYFDRLICQTQIPLFFKMASIPGPRHLTNDFMGNITFKYID